MIVTMGGLTEGGEWKDYDYILQNAAVNWQNAVLKLIRRVLFSGGEKGSTTTAWKPIQKC